MTLRELVATTNGISDVSLAIAPGMTARVHRWPWANLLRLRLEYAKFAQMLRELRCLLRNVSENYPSILSRHTIKVTRINIKTFN